MSVSCRRFCAAGVVLLALSLSTEAAGQTYYSHRMRGLGLNFGGIIADPITDAFLNPARVRALTGTQVYLAKHDSRFTAIPYPGVRRGFFGSVFLPPESYDRWPLRNGISVDPVELTMFAPVGEGVVSFSFEVGLNEGERLERNVSQAAFSSELELREETFARRTQDSHLLVTGAFGTGTPDQTGMGARIILERRDGDLGEVRSYSTDRLYPFSGNATSDYRFERTEGDFMEARAVLSVGVHRPGAVLRGLVVAAGYSRREFPIEVLTTNSRDDDTDGNGRDPWGGQGTIDFDRESFSSDRVYDGPSFDGRLHADFTESVTLTVSAQWTQRSGNGTGRYMVRHDVGPTAPLSTTDDVAYEYDGRDRQYSIMTGIGYQEDSLAPNLLLSMGVFASFSRENFAEDGVGTLSLMITDMTTPPIIVEADYFQRALRLRDMLRFQLPVAVEWRPIGSLALRLGGVFVGARVEEETVVRAHLTGAQLPPEYVGSKNDNTRVADTDVNFSMTNGIGVYLGEKDRLSIDLFSRHSDVTLATYTNLSVRYRF